MSPAANRKIRKGVLEWGGFKGTSRETDKGLAFHPSLAGWESIPEEKRVGTYRITNFLIERGDPLTRFHQNPAINIFLIMPRVIICFFTGNYKYMEKDIFEVIKLKFRHRRWRTWGN
jgi:hypothetical protein